MSKESEPVEAEYHVIRNPDDHIILIGVEEYPTEADFSEAIKYNHIKNRNRLLFGIPSLLFSIAGFVDIAQRSVPYIQTLESLKPDANLIGGSVELVISSALFAYSLNSFSQIRIKASEIAKVEFAFQNPDQVEEDT